MKELKIPFLCVFLLFSISLVAQQDAQYTQYTFNGLVLNPAYAGNRNAISLTFIQRNQWRNIPGSPKTLAASIHSPLGDHTAGGLSVENDAIGIHNRLSMYASFAYQIVGYNLNKLSLGIQAGFLSLSSDPTKLSDILDPTDPLFQEMQSQLLPNFGLGIFYDSPKFYAGFSVPHLLNNQLNEVAKLAAYERQYLLLAGFSTKLLPMVELKPSVLIKYLANDTPVQVDITTNFLFKEIFWLGATYRTQDAIAILAAFDFPRYNILEGLRLGISYDITTSELSDQTKGTLEIMLGWDFNSKLPDRQMSPRHF